MKEYNDRSLEEVAIAVNAENVCLKEELRQAKQSTTAYLRELHIVEDKLQKIEIYIDSCLALNSQAGETCPSGMTVTTKIKSILNLT